jgi:hypothetical protein
VPCSLLLSDHLRRYGDIIKFLCLWFDDNYSMISDVPNYLAVNGENSRIELFAAGRVFSSHDLSSFFPAGHWRGLFPNR